MVREGEGRPRRPLLYVGSSFGKEEMIAITWIDPTVRMSEIIPIPVINSN